MKMKEKLFLLLAVFLFSAPLTLRADSDDGFGNRQSNTTPIVPAPPLYTNWADCVSYLMSVGYNLNDADAACWQEFIAPITKIPFKPISSVK